MMNTTRNWFMLALLAGICLVTVVSVVEAQPTRYDTERYYNDRFEEEEPEQILMDLIARFGQTIMRARNMENNKRTVDFGLARGFSGTQEAKHRLGLAAANFAGGPGRKRRSDDTWSTLTAAGGHA